MNQVTDVNQVPVSGGNALRYFMRALWIVIRLLAALIFIQQKGKFFYQGF